MRQVIASQCSIAVFRQSSPAYVAPTLKRVRRGVARTGGAAAVVQMDLPLSSSAAGTVSKAQAGTYSVFQSVAKSRSGSYLIDAAGVVFKSQSGSYSVVASVQRSRSGSYLILVVGSLIRAARSSRRAPRMDGAGRRPRQTS